MDGGARLRADRPRAYALTDVNLENTRAFVQYREMGQARSLDEFAATLRRHVGLPWVNTIAADSAGNAFYGWPRSASTRSTARPPPATLAPTSTRPSRASSAPATCQR